MADRKDKQFTKNDMERLGIFQEMNYISIGDRYKAPNPGNFNEDAYKKRQMLPGGSKERSALQHGYFNEKYVRVMEGEAHSDPVKRRRQQRMKEAQKNIGKPFLPSSGDKKPSGLGNHYGTLSGPVTAFSPQSKASQAYKAPGKNLYTNPGKKGTGFGYLGVTIGQYQKYQSDAYDRSREISKKENEKHKSSLKGGAFKLNMAPKPLFDDNPYRSDKPLPPAKKESSGKSDLKPFKPSSPPKKPGGNHSGTFDPYPNHSADPYKVARNRVVNIVNKTGKTFVPNAGPKSAPTNSILNQNVIRSINKQNYKTLTTPIMTF